MIAAYVFSRSMVQPLYAFGLGRTDIELQQRTLAGSSKYGPRRILAPEEDATVCSPYLFSRSFRLKVQTKLAKMGEPLPPPRMRTIS